MSRSGPPASLRSRFRRACSVAGTEYLPVHPDLVVEVEAESSVGSFTNRLRPRVYRVRPWVYRLRPDLRPDDAAQ